MRILLFGKTGQLGWELQRSLQPLGELISLGTRDTPCGDFTKPTEVATTVRAVAPDVIVNAAAYTAVDKAESDRHTARTINAATPGVLAEIAAEMGSWLIHFSTDYVFDGSGHLPWNENSPVAPLNEYGRSKLAGEDFVRASGCNHLIFRTSWVYAARGANFAKTILKLAQQNTTLKVIDDQFGAPTGADLLADVTAHAIRAAVSNPDLGGTYHCAAAGVTTWHGYARHVIERGRAAGLAIRATDAEIKAVASCEFPTPAKRPTNSRLDTTKLKDIFNLALPHWQVGVDRMLTEILENK